MYYFIRTIDERGQCGWLSKSQNIWYDFIYDGSVGINDRFVGTKEEAEVALKIVQSKGYKNSYLVGPFN
jgi:hypothetical protein